MKHFPFKIINKGGKPIIQVEYRGETKEFVSDRLAMIKARILLICSLVTGRNLLHGSPEDEGDR